MYCVVEETLEKEEIGEYITYGIAICEDGKILRKISDISVSRQMVTELCERCNRLKLDPIHIDDVIEDNL